MMTLSYVLICSSFAFLLYALLYILIDYKQFWNGAPFVYAGTYKNYCIQLYFSYKITYSLFFYRNKSNFSLCWSCSDKRFISMVMEYCFSISCISSCYELMDNKFMDNNSISSLSERYYHNSLKIYTSKCYIKYIYGLIRIKHFLLTI